MRRKLSVLVVSFVFVTGSSGWGAAEVPTPVSPGGIEGVVLIGESCPTFLWGGVAEALGYELAVYRVKEGPEGVNLEPTLRVTLPGSATGWTPALDQCLERRGRYAWTVKARGDAAETGEWSEPRLFEVSPGPMLAEVDEALAVLRRYSAAKASTDGQHGPVTGIEAGAPSPLADQRSAVSTERLRDALTPELEHPDPQGRQHRDRRSSTLTPSKITGVHRPEAPLSQIGPGEIGAAAPTLGTASLTVDDQIHLGAASSVFRDGELFLWSDGADRNTALGTGALSSNTIGTDSTAVGYGALQANVGSSQFGSSNTAVGSRALHSNTIGSRNTAFGAGALDYNITGTDSTAIGYLALRNSTGHPEFGAYNTAVGSLALYSNTTGDLNTASGFQALGLNTTGFYNTATGVDALRSNTEGIRNTATGVRALRDNATGDNNTAIGANALASNTTGGSNTASGSVALILNTTGSYNTAAGAQALASNTTGSRNTASGNGALSSNTTASLNTASGAFALFENTTGSGNTASGSEALRHTTTGFQNTAAGDFALHSNTTGARNVAIGHRAGYSATTGSYNIFISNEGVADEANTIRIGTQGTQSRAFVAGIHTTLLSGGMPHAVYVDDTGQLGAPPPSSRRFKDEIEDMGENSNGLLALRPVTFRYSKEVVSRPRPLEFGLLAEEVAEFYPDLVTYDDEGRPFAVRYQVLIPMLLNELQKQYELNRKQEGLLEERRRDLERVLTRLARLEAGANRPAAASHRGRPPEPGR